MTQGTIALERHGKETSFPVMLFASFVAHVLAILVFLAAPHILPHGKRRPFGGSPPGGGLNVMTVDFRLGEAASAEEPAPAKYLTKFKEEEMQPKSKTEFPEPEKKKTKAPPAAKETMNVPASKRKLEGPYGTGADTTRDAAKSGRPGRGAISAFGPGTGGLGFGTGTGIPFPFPWYVEAVLTKLEISWAKPPLPEAEPKEYGAVVYFAIKRNGQVSQVQVEESSGIPVLDRSAVSAVYAAAPFPPLPNQWTEPDLAFRIRFTHVPK